MNEFSILISDVKVNSNSKLLLRFFYFFQIVIFIFPFWFWVFDYHDFLFGSCSIATMWFVIYFKNYFNSLLIFQSQSIWILKRIFKFSMINLFKSSIQIDSFVIMFLVLHQCMMNCLFHDFMILRFYVVYYFNLLNNTN